MIHVISATPVMSKTCAMIPGSPYAYSYPARVLSASQCSRTPSLFFLQESKIPFVPVKFIYIFSDTQSIYNRIVVDNAFLNEEDVEELLYCTHHERLYDATEYQWISFLRGEVRLVQTIYPRRSDLHVREEVCDVCARISQRCLGRQLESPLARLPSRPLTSAWHEHGM